MIELFARTFLTPYPSNEWHDVALYVGSDRDEAQRVLLSHPWTDKEIGVWVESDRGCKLLEDTPTANNPSQDGTPNRD